MIVPTTRSSCPRCASGEFPAGDAADVNKAVAAAEKAQPAWGALDLKERSKYLYKLAKRIRSVARNCCIPR